MITKEIAAILALRVYDQQPIIDENLPLEPQGWVKLNNPLPVTDGFAYGVFRNTTTNEVVISYRGTDGAVGMMGPDGVNNLGLAAGQLTSQAIQAAKIFVKVQELYGSDSNGSNISFTGHSLGGGLAGVMAVWFDRPAIVFDPAPFQLTALLPGTVNDLINLLGARSPLALRNYQTDIIGKFATREMAVDDHYTVGEFLSALGLTSNATGVYGTNTPYTFGNQSGDVSMFAMHSQALLAAGILSPSFRQATVAVQNSLSLIMSQSYYSKEPAGSAERNFLLDLIRSEQAAPNNGKLTHFAADLNKLGTNIAGLNKQAQDAIIAQGIEWYYWQDTDYAGKEFFTQSGALLQYTTAQGADLTGAQNNALPYVKLWLDGYMGSVQSNTLLVTTPSYATFEQWNVSAGTTGVSATALDANKSQIFIGQGGADTFTGGNKNDLLFGGIGDDTLDGGKGDDKLYGGSGTDTYTFSSSDLVGWGTDTIGDTDGIIKIDADTLSGGKSISPRLGRAWISDDKKYQFQFKPNALTPNGTAADSNGTLVIHRTGRLADKEATVLNNWSQGKFGITLTTDAALPVSPAQVRVVNGDTVPLNTTISDSGGDDRVQGGRGDDWIAGLGGNDVLEGGDGKTRFRTDMREQHICFKKHSYLSNRYGGYCPISHARKSISPGCAPSLAQSLQRAARKAVLQ